MEISEHRLTPTLGLVDFRPDVACACSLQRYLLHSPQLSA